MLKLILLFGKTVLILLTAATKFMFSPGMALEEGYDKAETIIITTIGGWMGILFFYYLGGWFTDVIIGFIVKRFRKKKKKYSTKGKRRIIRIKQRFGVIGISFLTPTILSIPIGSVIASKYFSKNRMTIPYLFFSLLLWSIIITIASEPIVRSIQKFLN
jgi:membrane protein DedA with SNARE-associated domain